VRLVPITNRGYTQTQAMLFLVNIPVFWVEVMLTVVRKQITKIPTDFADGGGG